MLSGRRQTLVTAIYDLDSSAPLGGRDRPVGYYLPSLASISALGAALVVYTRPRHVEQIDAFLQELGVPAIVVGRDLESVPRFERIQELRTQQGFERQPWRDRCHVLCHAKPAWLAEQAVSNPFGSRRLYWIDAGLAYPGLFPLRYLPDYLSSRCAIFRPPVLDALEQRDEPDSPWFTAALQARTLVMIGMRPLQLGTIHQMSLDDHLRFVGTGAEAPIETHVVGALFGGTPTAVGRLYADYDRVLARMLAAGLVGTEENVLTILYHRDPAPIRLLSFSTWYHEDSDVRPPEPHEFPFYRIFESLVGMGSASSTRAAASVDAPADCPAVDMDAWRPTTIAGLQWTEMDGAFLLWRSGDARLHGLNNVGTLLLELADGQHSVTELAGVLRDLFQLDAAPTEEVRDFLGSVLRAELLERVPDTHFGEVDPARRAFVEALVGGGFRPPALVTFP